MRKWYIGKALLKTGEIQWIEAVNGGPFKTLKGAKRSLTAYGRHKRYRKIDIIELVAGEIKDTV
jgi:hypothetical protein